MQKKYIMLMTSLTQGYHLSDTELEDLELYLKAKLRQIEFIKKYNS